MRSFIRSLTPFPSADGRGALRLDRRRRLHFSRVWILRRIPILRHRWWKSSRKIHRGPPKKWSARSPCPIETVLFGIPRLTYVRSIAIFGLSDVKLYFGYDSDYFWDRQEATQSPPAVRCPANFARSFRPNPHRRNLSLSSRRPGLITQRTQSHAGLVRHARNQAGVRHRRRRHVRRHHARISRRSRSRASSCNTTSRFRRSSTLSSSNANAGGNYLTHGQPERQRPRPGPAAIHRRNAKCRSSPNTTAFPFICSDVADVHEGSQPRLGQVGVNHDRRRRRRHRSVPARRTIAARPASASNEKVASLNGGLLPPGMHLTPSTTAPISSTSPRRPSATS